MSVKLFDTERRPDAGSEEKNYSMWIVGSNLQSFHREIRHHTDGGSRGSWSFRHEAGTAGCGEPNGQVIGGVTSGPNLRDFHWIGEFLQEASLLWERYSARPPNCQDRGVYNARCRTAETDSPR